MTLRNTQHTVIVLLMWLDTAMCVTGMLMAAKTVTLGVRRHATKSKTRRKRRRLPRCAIHLGVDADHSCYTNGWTS